ncbi:hypothetical protein JCM17478_25330 [Thermopirellula anaerolimosa]
MVRLLLAFDRVNGVDRRDRMTDAGLSPFESNEWGSAALRIAGIVPKRRIFRCLPIGASAALRSDTHNRAVSVILS